jgi:hypothetical protein
MYRADNDAHHRYSIRGWMAIISRMALPCLALRSVRSTGVAFQRTAARLTLPQNSKGYDAACTERRAQTSANNTRSRTRAKIPQQSTCTHKDASTHRHVHVRKAEKAHAHAHACALTHSPHMHTACALTHVHASTDGRAGFAHLRPDPYVRRPPRAPLLGIF